VMRSQRSLTNRLSKFSGSYSNFPVTGLNRPSEGHSGGKIGVLYGCAALLCIPAASTGVRQSASAASLEVLYQHQIAAHLINLRV
jgi:hypothetical protein